ncbi:pentapeptide repeat-containing protein [Streptomyces sp. NPDC001903]|uniref:pentapeptide repeat-containing protein n=1 Tax=Streptomyces sp. NPDC001903 TaxID=3364622 RepID=UPI0036BAB5A2
MTATTPDAAAAPSAPDWPHCGRGTDSIGCRGRRVDPYAECLAHLGAADRSAYLTGLHPGADLDHRGTPFTEELLRELLAAFRDPATGRTRLGSVWFHETRFSGDVSFHAVEFSGEARFSGAAFDGATRFSQASFGADVTFDGAEFGDDAYFSRAEFSSSVWFNGARFRGGAKFDRAEFGGGAWFIVALFHDGAWFNGARFRGDARFEGVEIRHHAGFVGTVFERASEIGPLVCLGELDLSEAVFEAAVTIEAATATLLCRRTRWTSTAALRLRYAAVDLGDAVLEYPVSIAARSRPFTMYGVEELPEQDLTDPRVRIMSLRGVDAAHLVLTDVDLTHTLFAGTIHLDQLRLEGLYALALTPTGLRRRGLRPVRWTPRRTLAEEHHWRAARFAGAGGWAPAPDGEEVLEPAALAPVYRQLRKSFEDGKHEPGAADFYYGEMEMRRHANDIPRSERILLTAYWALSGYGLRASRALGWLMLAMTVTVLVMMLWGLPKDDPKPLSTGTFDGRRITMTTTTPDPVNPDGPFRERLSTQRFEKSLRVVINSVVFRSSGQSLTTVGTYSEMASRFGEPVLLGLAALAVRGRVKR